jgi:hypothetical protein
MSSIFSFAKKFPSEAREILRLISLIIPEISGLTIASHVTANLIDDRIMDIAQLLRRMTDNFVLEPYSSSDYQGDPEAHTRLLLVKKYLSYRCWMSTLDTFPSIPYVLHPTDDEATKSPNEYQAFVLQELQDVLGLVRNEIVKEQYE